MRPLKETTTVLVCFVIDAYWLLKVASVLATRICATRLRLYIASLLGRSRGRIKELWA